MDDVTNASAPTGLGRLAFWLDRFAPLVAGIALAIPTLAAYYPPMTDLGMHESVIGIMRHWGDEAYFPRDLYQLNLGHPNQLFHVSAWALSLIFDTRWACKIIIALSQILILHAGARFADHVGRSRWSALLLAPLALGFTYYWGLVANLVGYAALLYALPIFDRAAEKATVRLAVVSSALLVLLFYAHGSVFVAGAAALCFLTLCYPFSVRKTGARLLPAVFAVVFQMAHYRWEAQFFTAGQVSAKTSYFTFAQKIVFLPNVLFGSHELSAQLLLLALAALGIVAMLVGRIQEARARSSAPADAEAPEPAAKTTRLLRLQALLRRYRFEVLGLGFLLGYFVMPFNWRGATLLHERFLSPAWALLVVMVAPRVASRLARLAVVVVPLGILFVSWPQFVDADRAQRDLAAIIEKVPTGSAVASCVVDRTIAATRVFNMGISVARVVAVRGGRTSYSLTISPISPVQVQHPARWNEYEARVFRNGSFALRPTHDLDRFGWIIAQSRDPEARKYLIVALAPDAEHVDTRGEWLLFRSKHQLVPIDSGDVPLPRPMESLLDRVVQIEAAIKGPPPGKR